MRYEQVAALNPDEVRCPYPAYAELREAGVTFVKAANAWIISRPEDIKTVCRDTETFSSANAIGAPPFPPDSEIAKYVPLLLLADEPEHSRIRKLVQRAFTPSRIARFEQPIGELVESLLEKVHTDEPQTTFDWVDAVALPVPIRVILIILGVDDEHLDDFRRLSEELASKVGHDDADPGEQMRVAKEFIGHVAPLLDQAGLDGEEDSILATIANEVRAGNLDRHSGARFVLELILAGNVTTTDHLGSTMRLLAENPDLVQRCRQEPNELRNFIEESFRLESPIQGLFRTTTKDTEVGGVAIPAGSRLQLQYGAANRSDELFEDPDTLDLSRRAAGTHLAFGHGVHTCLGNMVARLESKVVFQTVLEQTTSIELAADPYELPYLPSCVNRGPLELPIRVTWA